MSRETISRHALRSLIDAEMQGVQACSSLEATVARDDTRCNGANWRVAIAARTGAKGDAGACDAAIKAVVDKLAAQYDIPERVPNADEIRTWTNLIPSKGCPAQPMTEPVPPHVLDHLLESNFVVMVDGLPERTVRGDQVAAG